MSIKTNIQNNIYSLLTKYRETRKCSTTDTRGVQDDQKNLKNHYEWLLRLDKLFKELNVIYGTNFYPYYMEETQEQPKICKDVSENDHQILLKAVDGVKKIFISMGFNLLKVLETPTCAAHVSLRDRLWDVLRTGSIEDWVLALTLTCHCLLTD